jgi:hypothetical protein
MRWPESPPLGSACFSKLYLPTKPTSIPFHFIKPFDSGTLESSLSILVYTTLRQTRQVNSHIMVFLFSKPAETPGSAVPAVIIGMFVAFGGVLCKSCLHGFSILNNKKLT